MRKLVLAATAATALIVPAAGATAGATAPKATTIPLQAGIAPEGVVTGRGATFYAGSLAGGQIVRGNLRKGTVGPFITAPATPITVGLSYDRRNDLLFAAGGPSGRAAVYDATTGATVAALTLTTGPSFVNDVIVTRTAAYFTNSQVPELYVVPIGKKGAVGSPRVLPLSGPAAAFVPGFNLNGIEATEDGKTLIVVNSTLGKLFTVDAATGASAEIDLGGASVTAGDGLWLEDDLLYVVRNRLNQLAVFELDDDDEPTSAALVDTITSPLFEVPTTMAIGAGRIIVVNAQFGLPQPNPFEAVVLKVDDDD